MLLNLRCRAFLLWLTSMNTLVVFCERSVQLGAITLQCYLVNKMCLTSLWRMMVQSLPIRWGLQISATESMYVVNVVRFRLIPIMSPWRVTFVTFCIYVGEERELGVIWWSLNCQFVSLTLSLLTSYIYIYGAPCKARIFNVVYYMDLRLTTLEAVSFYLVHNVSTLNQCKVFLYNSCV
jgi:hypothetical protein